MGAFSGLGGASRGYTSNTVQEGTYLVRLDECSYFDSSTGERWKNTLTVLRVESGSHRVGEVVHTFFNLKAGSTGREVFQRNLKAFIAGVLDCPDEAVGEAEALRVSGEEQIMAGLVTVLRVVKRPSKTSVDEQGQPRMYNVYSWTPSLSDQETYAAIGETNEERAAAWAKFFPTRDVPA